ncbi:transferase [Flavobacterium sp. ST-75]|uniref:Transferase n=1 Tax=Flavobacterium rhizophilum TaxID=3163296 RepID=A0ABW8YCL5_9FLAO
MTNSRSIYKKLKFYLSINWVKTLRFNFKTLPYAQARKLPVLFYGKVRFQDISGEFIIDAPVHFGMIGFGQRYEKNTVHKGIAEIALGGKVVFKGMAQFGKDYFVCVERGASVEFGHMFGLGTEGKIVCTEKMTFGKYVRIASESRIVDTDFHQMVNTVTNEKYPLSAPVILGDYTYLSNRVSVLKGTITPPYCTVSANSLCNKDYTALGENILLGGVPAKLLKEHITRDWKTEEALFDKWMKV